MGVFKRARASLSPEHDLADRFREALTVEWRDVGPSREALVNPLVTTLTQEENLLTIEIAAMALATQGEDGLTALMAVLGHDDFAVRSKAVIGIGLLDRSARWAVPLLRRALVDEPVWLLTADLLRALGRIGGQEAEATLCAVLDGLDKTRPRDEALCQVALESLAAVRLAEALE
jgi:HEAT repeat protein